MAGCVLPSLHDDFVQWWELRGELGMRGEPHAAALEDLAARMDAEYAEVARQLMVLGRTASGWFRLDELYARRAVWYEELLARRHLTQGTSNIMHNLFPYVVDEEAAARASLHSHEDRFRAALERECREAEAAVTPRQPTPLLARLLRNWADTEAKERAKLLTAEGVKVASLLQRLHSGPPALFDEWELRVRDRP